MKLFIVGFLGLVLTSLAASGSDDELPAKLRLCFEFVQRYYERQMSTVHQLNFGDCMERLHRYAQKANRCSRQILLPLPVANDDFDIAYIGRKNAYDKAWHDYTEGDHSEDPTPPELIERHDLQIEELEEICREIRTVQDSQRREQLTQQQSRLPGTFGMGSIFSSSRFPDLLTFNKY